jgi:hypothetical protein
MGLGAAGGRTCIAPPERRPAQHSTDASGTKLLAAHSLRCCETLRLVARLMRAEHTMERPMTCRPVHPCAYAPSQLHQLCMSTGCGKPTYKLTTVM